MIDTDKVRTLTIDETGEKLEILYEAPHCFREGVKYMHVRPIPPKETNLEAEVSDLTKEIDRIRYSERGSEEQGSNLSALHLPMESPRQKGPAMYRALSRKYE